MTGGHEPHLSHPTRAVCAAAAAAAAEAAHTGVATADEYAARLVRERGFEVRQMVGDGNCLFRAVGLWSTGVCGGWGKVAHR